MKKILLTVILLMLIASPAFAFGINYVGPIEFHFKSWGVGREYVPAGANWLPEDSTNTWFASGDPQGLPAGLALTLSSGVYTAGDGLEDSWGITRLDDIRIQTGQPGAGTYVWQRPNGVGNYVVGIYYGFDDIMTNGQIVDHTGGLFELYELPLAGIPDGTGLDPDVGRTAQNAFTGFTGNAGQLLAQFQAVSLNNVPAYAGLPGAVTRRDTLTAIMPTYPTSGSGTALFDVVEGVGSSWQLFNGDRVYDDWGNIWIPSHDLYLEFTYQYWPGNGGALTRFDSTVSDPGRGFSTPEPTSMLLFGIGMLGLAVVRKKKVV